MKYFIYLCLAASLFSQEKSAYSAEEIAGKVMARLGGADAWNNTRFVSWNFFGRRLHVWDKHTGNARIEAGNTVTLYNIGTNGGKFFRDGIEVTAKDSVEKFVATAKRMWNNDAYWLFMPYKLKDNGVTLKRIEDAAAASGEACYRLQLTFEDVGDTPENKYYVYVRKDDLLVVQWDYFSKYTDEKPRFSTPWANWQQFGNIWLADSRGKWKHSDIRVLESIPSATFNSATKIDFSKLEGLK